METCRFPAISDLTVHGCAHQWVNGRRYLVEVGSPFRNLECVIDVLFLWGDGVEDTRAYLPSRSTPEEPGLLRCRASGDPISVFDGALCSTSEHRPDTGRPNVLEVAGWSS